MSELQKDILTVRELAKRYMEIASSEKHERMRRRFRDTNDLKVVRPPLIMEEIPWHEMNMDGELDCHAEDGRLRSMEWSLRVALFREKHFRCDNYAVPWWPVYKSYSSTGSGFAIDEDRVAVDKRNNIVSHRYHDVLADESALEAWHEPVITPYPENDRANMAFAEEVMEGIMPVRLTGHGIYYSPWDEIAMLRGVEPVLVDMVERPEYLHRIMKLFTRGMERTMDQMEQYGLYEPEAVSLHCTPGDFTHKEAYDPSFGKCENIWFRTMAQMFSTVSPEAHYEFDVQYSIPLASRCAHTYYGCCEPLSDRIDILKRYPNLRKVGCSPWADVEKTAEQLGGDYVLSRKPSPAHAAISTDPDQIRREIAETAEACLKHGTPCDITLKDISTVSYKPANLILWAEAASSVLDEYYGEA